MPLSHHPQSADRQAQFQAEAELAARMHELSQRRAELEQALEVLREDTAALVHEGARAGFSAYRMAELLNLSAMQVGRIRRAGR